MSIEVVHDFEKGCYVYVDVYGIFAESKWYKTEEKLAFALATNKIAWSSKHIEYDKDAIG